MSELGTAANSSPRSFRSSSTSLSASLTNTPGHVVSAVMQPWVSTQLHEGDVVLPTDAVIVLTKGGSDMDDAGTVGHGDVIIADHTPGGLVQFAHGEVEQGLVFHALQVDTGHFRVILHFLAAENGGNQRLAP